MVRYFLWTVYNIVFKYENLHVTPYAAKTDFACTPKICHYARLTIIWLYLICINHGVDYISACLSKRLENLNFIMMLEEY